MKPQTSAIHNDFDAPLTSVEEAEDRSEDDLWFLPVAFGSRFQLKRLAET
jgi:hypothetical protein